MRAVNTAMESVQVTKNISDILTFAFNHTSEHSCIVVYDLNSELSKIITEGYQKALPNAQFVDFDQTSPDTILESFRQLKPLDLVVLIQSTNFRLESFRIRMELFKRGLKVIEHPHLSRMNSSEVQYYIQSLAYDPAYYRGLGYSLKTKIDQSLNCLIDTGGEILTYGSKLEPAKLNVGDYSQMQNVGGQFPIGEVFTEAVDFDSVNGRARIFCFGDSTYNVNAPDIPITLVIERSLVVNVENSTPAFDQVMQSIIADEGQVFVRELGFGLNRAFSRAQKVSDVGTFERMCGVHLSLGRKHDSYVKPGFKRGAGKNHIDVFLATEFVRINDEVIFQSGKWTV